MLELFLFLRLSIIFIMQCSSAGSKLGLQFEASSKYYKKIILIKFI